MANFAIGTSPICKIFGFHVCCESHDGGKLLITHVIYPSRRDERFHSTLCKRLTKKLRYFHSYDRFWAVSKDSK